jgi:DNA-binding Lrp family transcriptional regulator
VILRLKNDRVSLDDVDLSILAALQSDSRQTYASIGEKLGVSHSTIG